MDNGFKTRIQYIEPDKDRRIIAVSDIHGNDGYLKGVLEQAGYSEQDILVIVGDMIEKGKESLKTIRTILNLRKENPDVHALMGNVEHFQLRIFNENGPDACREFIGGLRWRKEIWGRSFFLDILEELGICLADLCDDNISDVKKRIRENYREELDFLQTLPTIIAMGNFIFVHGGIPTDSIEELQGTDAFPYLKWDEFMNRDVQFQKTVIVGHWPVCLYREDVYCMNPRFDDKKHIIGIDGGCSLNIGAQLNALLIPHAWADMKDISYTAYDDFPRIVAGYAQNAEKGAVEIRYADSIITPLEEKDGIVRAVHAGSGKSFHMPKEWLYQSGDEWHCDNYSAAKLGVTEGDVLSVIREYPMGKFVKKDGVLGWYCPKG